MSSAVHPAVHHNWTRIEKMDPNGLLQFQWHLRDKEIVFKVTVNSRGFIAIGFLYPNPKISGFDMALAWIHDRTGKANILVSEARSSSFLFVCVSNLHEQQQHSQCRRYVFRCTILMKREEKHGTGQSRTERDERGIMKNAFLCFSSENVLCMLASFRFHEEQFSPLPFVCCA